MAGRVIQLDRSFQSECWLLVNREDGTDTFYCGDDGNQNPTFESSPEWAFRFSNVASGKELMRSLEQDGFDVSHMDVRKCDLRMDIYSKWRNLHGNNENS